jgi:hypothetical protein
VREGRYTCGMAGELPQPSPEERAAYWKSIQDEHGVDLTLIRENLKRSPIERLRRADAARRAALRLMELGRRARERRNEPA